MSPAPENSEATISLNEIDANRINLQYKFIYVLGTVFIGVFAAVNLVKGNMPLFFVLTACLACTIAVNLFAVRANKLKLAGWYYSLTLIVLVMYLLVTGGVAQTGPMWTYPIVIIIISLLGYKPAALVCIYLIIFASGVFMVDDKFDFIIDYDNQFEYRYIATLLALAGIALSIEYSRYSAYLLSKSLEDKILALSRTDPLTGLLNRRGFEERFLAAKNRFERHETVFSMMLIDIDNFKAINDEHGHLIGDSIITGIANLIQKETRSMDEVGRWGGEEFIVLLQNTELAQAEKVAEKIRAQVKSDEDLSDLIDKHASVSIGVTVHKRDQGLSNMVEKADKALYVAKKAGRDKVLSEV